MKRTPTPPNPRLLPLLLFAALLLGNSCALFTRNQNANAGAAAYIEASVAYETDATEYKAANDVLRSFTLTAEQAGEYQAARSAVRAADNVVYSDLKVWRRTPGYQQPPDFVSHFAALKVAQTRVILLAREVGGR